MWGTSVHYGAEYESYAYPCEYDEGYAEEVEDYTEDYPTAPRCWSGSTCPFLAKGTCQYYHPAQDEDEEQEEEEAREDQEEAAEPASPALKTTPATVEACRPCARPWNVLVNPGNSAAGKVPEAPLLLAAGESSVKEPAARLRSRSPRRKILQEDASAARKEAALAKARFVLAELKEKKEAQRLHLSASEPSIAAKSGA